MADLRYSAPTIRAVTQAAGDNSTLIATDAFVTTAVNNAISGVNPAVAVQVATTAAANTSGLTYNNGVSGVGATFTGTANTALVIDGRTLLLGDRVLVKNDTQSPSGAFNGIYSVTTIQSLGIAPILTRSLDYNQPSDINNTGAIPVILGTANASTSWVQTAQIVTVGTTPLAFTEFTLNPTTLMTTTVYDAAAIAQQVVGTTASQTLTNKTLTTPVLNGTPTGTGVSSTPTASIIPLWDTSKNLSANSVIEGFTTTATAAGTTTMTITSTQIQAWTGSSTQTIKLPTTSVVAGAQYTFLNQSTGAITIQSSGANSIIIIPAGSSAILTALVVTPTSAANCGTQYLGVLGYAQVVGNLTTTATSTTQATGLTVTVIIPPGGGRIKITFWAEAAYTTAGRNRLSIWDGTVGSGTLIAQGDALPVGASGGVLSATLIASTAPSAGSHTYNVGFFTTSAGTATIEGDPTFPAFIMVE